MPKFKYNGDHPNMQAFGLDFSEGKEAETKDAHIVGKLRGNSHFDEVVKKTAAEKAKEKAAKGDDIL